MKQSICTAVLLVILSQVLLTDGAETYVSCLTCPDVASPSDCRQAMTCGVGEICFAREFTDHRGLQGFRLGCEDQARCTMFLNAKQLFGKRDIINPDPAPADNCYECCTTDECNGYLCHGKGGGHVTQTPHVTTAPQSCTCSQTVSMTTTGEACPVAVCPNIVPPRTFVPYKDSSYLFSTWSTTWDEARAQCKKIGADLVSINTWDEQEFLVHEMINGNNMSSFFVTGGAYSHSFHEWSWVDRTPLTYTNWEPGEPTGSLSHSTDYHIVIGDPYNSALYVGGTWSAESAAARQFICEKHHT